MLFVGFLVVVALSFSAAEECGSVDCSSWGYKYATCSVPGAKDIKRLDLTIKYSRSSCSYGYSYGPGTEYIWVNHGCRGRFYVCYEKRVTCTNIDCSSHNYEFASCAVPGARKVTSVNVIQKYSRSSCEEGHGFGSDAGNIWVNHGCRVKFYACYI